MRQYSSLTCPAYVFLCIIYNLPKNVFIIEYIYELSTPPTTSHHSHTYNFNKHCIGQVTIFPIGTGKINLFLWFCTCSFHYLFKLNVMACLFHAYTLVASCHIFTRVSALPSKKIKNKKAQPAHTRTILHSRCRD